MPPWHKRAAVLDSRWSELLGSLPSSPKVSRGGDVECERLGGPLPGIELVRGAVVLAGLHVHVVGTWLDVERAGAAWTDLAEAWPLCVEDDLDGLTAQILDLEARRSHPALLTRFSAFWTTLSWPSTSLILILRRERRMRGHRRRRKPADPGQPGAQSRVRRRSSRDRRRRERVFTGVGPDQRGEVGHRRDLPDDQSTTEIILLGPLKPGRLSSGAVPRSD